MKEPRTSLPWLRAMELDSSFESAEKAYYLARQTGDPGDWAACAWQAERYLRLGGVRNVHLYLNMALNAVGRVYDALDSCRAGLRLEPGNEHLVRNAALYEDYLARMRAASASA